MYFPAVFALLTRLFFHILFILTNLGILNTKAYNYKLQGLGELFLFAYLQLSWLVPSTYTVL